MRKTKELILTGIFTALIIVGSFIKIPLYPVPVVLTYLCVNLVILLANRKTATLSVLIYILIGLAGIPVFTQGGGIGYIFNLSNRKSILFVIYQSSFLLSHIDIYINASLSIA